MAPSSFDLFREKGEPTYYGSQDIPPIADVQSITIFFSCCLAAVACLVVVIGTRGKERYTSVVRLFNVTAVGLAIIVAIFGENWQVGSVSSHCPYRMILDEHVMAKITARVGLHGVNISMAVNEVKSDAAQLYFNERYEWIGKPIDDLRVAHHDAMQRGMPDAILRVLTYFTVDEGSLRWGRAFRASGYYADILLWTAFSFWSMASILTYMVVWYSSMWMLTTGSTLGLLALLYHLMQPTIPLVIPLGDGFLTLEYGWNFWLVIGTASWATLLGLVLFICEICIPADIRYFLDIEADEDKVAYDDDVFKDNFDLKVSPNGKSYTPVIQRQGYVNGAFDPDETSDSKHRTTAILNRLSNNKYRGQHPRFFGRSMSEGNFANVRKKVVITPPNLESVSSFSSVFVHSKDDHEEQPRSSMSSAASRESQTLY